MTNSRIKLRDIAVVVAHLARQVICDIWLCKARKEALLNNTLTNAEVARSYNDRLLERGNDEEQRHAGSTIENVSRVYDKMLSIPPVREIILRLAQERLSLSPFNSIARLVDIYYTCRAFHKREWWFAAADDGLSPRALDIGDLRRRKIRGNIGSSLVCRTLC